MGALAQDWGYDEGNHVERAETQALNMRLLNCSDDHSLKIPSPVGDLDKRLTEGFQDEAACLIHDLCQSFNSWGFKDPRTVLTYTEWAKVLPVHRLIVVYRHPSEVWEHYSRREKRFRIIKKYRTGMAALRTWYVYNSEILRILKSTDMEFCVLSFSKLMTEETEREKLQKFTNRPLIDRRRKDLYRAKENSSLAYRVTVFIQERLFHRSAGRVLMTLRRLGRV